MDYVDFGKTGLKVSVAGLGCGGNSRLGQTRGMSEDESVGLVRAAMDLGVNLLDTAANYKTEGIVGKAIKSVPRDQVVVTTKASMRGKDGVASAEEMIASLDNSLRELDTDYVDVFQLHAVAPDAYEHALNVLAPALLREKEKGKFRHLGITETSPFDHEQKMLQCAVQDGIWEVMMLGFNMMHQNARHKVFPETIKHGIGTLLMFVVRNVFSQPGNLQAVMRERAEKGEIPQALAEMEDPLGFLIHEGGASSLTDAAYRFVRHEPGVSVVLFGTGNVDHLKVNIDSICKPPLPKADTDKLSELFGHLLGVGLELPDRSARRDPENR
jgi:aryl-alcohol dehydrogenase-like predicted oxidoreductase